MLNLNKIENTVKVKDMVLGKKYSIKGHRDTKYIACYLNAKACAVCYESCLPNMLGTSASITDPSEFIPVDSKEKEKFCISSLCEQDVFVYMENAYIVISMDKYKLKALNLSTNKLCDFMFGSSLVYKAKITGVNVEY